MVGTELKKQTWDESACDDYFLLQIYVTGPERSYLTLREESAMYLSPTILPLLQFKRQWNSLSYLLSHLLPSSLRPWQHQTVQTAETIIGDVSPLRSFPAVSFVKNGYCTGKATWQDSVSWQFFTVMKTFKLFCLGPKGMICCNYS